MECIVAIVSKFVENFALKGFGWWFLDAGNSLRLVYYLKF